MSEPTRQDYERAATTLRDAAQGFVGYSVTHHGFGGALIEAAVDAAALLSAAAERMTPPLDEAEARWRPEPPKEAP